MVTRAKEDEVQLPPLVVKKDLAEDLDNLWHELRYANRSECLREVIAAGIVTLRDRKKAPGQ